MPLLSVLQAVGNLCAVETNVTHAIGFIVQYRKAMTLENKIAIVTGGDSGIGRAIVLAFAQAGAAVTINYHSNQEAAQEVKKQIEDGGGKALIVQGDVSKVADVQKLVQQTVQTFGRLDIMVNNAGMETRTSVLEASEKDFDTVIGVNLKGAFFGTQFAAKQFLAQQSGGKIINISSVHEDWPMPGNTPYCCAKGGVRMLTRTAGVELAPHGITVVGVGPGAVATPINKGTLADPEKKAALENAIPLGRVASPEEIANLVAWLASDKSDYVTATTYFIDGGIMQASVGL
jgi:glucose 1-dehydrogenase